MVLECLAHDRDRDAETGSPFMVTPMDDVAFSLDTACRWRRE